MENTAKRLRAIPVVILIIVFVVGLVSVPGVAWFEGELDWRSVADGGWSRAAEQSFSENMALAEVSRSVWGGVRYRVFGEGTRGVLVGDEGWLFTTEEYEVSADPELRMAENIDAVDSIRRRLSERGISLVIVLVPAKARIYNRKTPHVLPALAQKRYDLFRSRLIEIGIAVPDLARALNDASQKDRVFLQTDTHWTPFGAKAAADAVVVAIEADGSFPTFPKIAYTLRSADKQSFTGDLVSFLSLGMFAEIAGPEPEIVEPYVAEQLTASSLGLFDVPEIPVAVVGTSYSADSRFGFVEALKNALQSDVLSVAVRGEGPFAPMNAYLESETIEEIPPHLVIWEIPERYVMQPW
jgi:alginate O-acetyltransferase complex protein AlgJ